jgi:hypothetical protein
MTERGLDFVLNYHRNRNFWVEREFNNWEFNGWSTQRENIDKSIKKGRDYYKDFESELTPSYSLNLDKETSYITVGKGWP